MIQPPSSQRIASKQAFLFTGQGAQYVRMGMGLYSDFPIFKAALDACIDACDAACHRRWSLRDLLFSESGTVVLSDGSMVSMNETAYAQPALFAVEYALAKTWLNAGIIPDCVMGHSIGELVAATFAGVMDVSAGMRLVVARGRLMQALPSGGSMAAVMGSLDRVKTAIAVYTSRVHAACVAVAGINAPEQTVISGADRDVKAVLALLKSEYGVSGQLLVVSHAFHSELMAPMLADFLTVASAITYHPNRYPLMSNITGQAMVVGDQAGQVNAQYWVCHVRSPVHFLQGAQALLLQGYRLFIEVGPHPVLIGLVRRIARDALPQAVLRSDPLKVFPSLRRGQVDKGVLTQSLDACASLLQA